ncbi:MAG: 2,3-bisphosphoglycerate-independent phosphoglycerate mutase [Thermodesulfobacteriota bacterium]
MSRQQPCLLMILDGWGINPDVKGNAVKAAPTHFLNELMRTYPATELICCGEAVGLPKGIMGNSEVGHLNIGAGRIVYQELLRIDRSIQDGSFFENQVLNQAMASVRNTGKSLHLIGLVSDGGVHSQLTHVTALLELATRNDIERVYVHAILDGRDTPPDSGAGFLEQLTAFVHRRRIGTIATICGRYYAMDRDTRWDRTQKAFLLYTEAEGLRETDPVQAVRNAYGRGETDEFVKPIVLTDNDGNALGTVSDGDAVLFFNFRADRVRQITRAFTSPDFTFFPRGSRPELSAFVCMTLYDEKFSLPMAFPPVQLNDILGEVISQNGLAQLRIAETEKYAHVTYFFNGGEEKPFPGEDRCLIPSPREVSTYDQKPEMSAREVTREVLNRIRSEKYDLIVMNFANMDMVGHTGILEAAIQAVRTVDDCVREIAGEILVRGGKLLVTADHGNAEKMIDDNGHPHTAHTLNPVPLILVDDSRRNARLRKGVLGDIAPTILEIMGISKPEKMTGTSLLIG